MTPFATTCEPPSATFDSWAQTYDGLFTESRIGRAQRASVWREIDRYFGPGQRILELNCGTGVDALHLAERGVRVVACDVSARMIDAALDRLSSAGFGASVDLHVLPSERLWQMEGSRHFDGALSNFAGLNCVEDLGAVAKELARLLRPRAKLVICVFGRWCAWEIMWYLAKRNPQKAFRRLSRRETTVNLGATAVRVYYPSVRDIRRAFAPFFRLTTRKGVGVAVPPSYLEPLAARWRSAFEALKLMEHGLTGVSIIHRFADHALLTFERVRD